MSCSEDALFELSRGELSPSAARPVRAHVARCASCARELAWLSRERASIALVVDTTAPLPDVEGVLARVVPQPPRPRWAWATGIFALGLAPAAALAAIVTLGAPLPLAALPDRELASVETAPACFLGGDGEESGVARMEAMYAACLVASPGPSRRDDHGVTEATFSSHGREACE